MFLIIIINCGNIQHTFINKFEDNSIDAIYIDGDHSYEGVKNDLELYYPKVKKKWINIM